MIITLPDGNMHIAIYYRASGLSNLIVLISEFYLFIKYGEINFLTGVSDSGAL